MQQFLDCMFAYYELLLLIGLVLEESIYGKKSSPRAVDKMCVSHAT